MKLRVPTLAGQVLDARLTSGESGVVLEVATTPPRWFTPETAGQCELLEGTAKEFSELRAYGFAVVDRRSEVAPPRPEDDAVVRMLIPIGRSGWAIAAGYAGLFSLIVVPAPLALILGVIALWHLKKNPTKRGLPRAIFGLVMGLVGTVILILVMMPR